MDRRTDLPALEAVQADYRRGVIAGLVAAVSLLSLFDLMIGSGYATYRRYGGDNPLVIASVIGLLPLLHAWVIFRLLTFASGWATDERGLTARSLVRRRFVAWSDVARTETLVDSASKDAVSRRTFRLTARRGCWSFVLYCGDRLDETRSGARLAASLWQHLRRRGLAEGMYLSPAVESLWDQIPDELPKVLTWSALSPPRWSGHHTLLAVIAVFLLTSTVGLGIQAGDPFGHTLAWWAGGEWILVFGPIFIGLRQDWLRTARQCVVDDLALTAETRCGSVRIPWVAVADAHWRPSAWDGRPGLLITGQDGDRKVLAPYDGKDEASGRLILALIRALRGAGEPQAIIVPEALRISPQSDPGRTRAWMARPS
jgi:hypothetical protein